MRSVIVAAALLALPTSVTLDAAPARKVGGQCAPLKLQYENDIDLVSRYVAFSSALGRSADPEIRSSVEQKQSNALARARLDIDLLKASGCSIPPLVPVPKKYEPDARSCALSMIMSRYSDDRVKDCNPEKWQAYIPPK